MLCHPNSRAIWLARFNRWRWKLSAAPATFNTSRFAAFAWKNSGNTMQTCLASNRSIRLQERNKGMVDTDRAADRELPCATKHGDEHTEGTMDLSDSTCSLSSSNHTATSRCSWRNYNCNSYASLLASIPGADSEDSDDDLDDSFSPSMCFNRSITMSSVASSQKLPADFEQWDIIKILGEGAFGQVAQVKQKRALHQSLNDTFRTEGKEESYALKMLSKYQIVCDRQVDIVIAEKKLMELANNHPFVVKLRAAWHDEKLIYLLQEFVQGGELFTLMLHPDQHPDLPTKRKSLPEPNVQFYAACLADALHYLHVKCRIVYRDLKPENILLDALGYPKLIDLGAAKLLVKNEDNQYHTRTLCGTPCYVAPEQISGSHHTFGVDHWVLAVLVYEMLAAEHPFDEWDGSNEFALYERIASDDEFHPPLPVRLKLSANVRQWIDELLVKDPAQRLGATCQDEDSDSSALQRHPWLSCIDVRQLRRRAIRAPWVPRLCGLDDSTHFDNWDHLDPVYQQPHSSRLTVREEALFAAFDE